MKGRGKAISTSELIQGAKGVPGRKELRTEFISRRENRVFQH